MQAYKVDSEYDADIDYLRLLVSPWKAKDGPYPQEANYLIHDRIQNLVYGIVWGSDHAEAIRVAFRIATTDLARQISDPVGEASYYERLI